MVVAVVPSFAKAEDIEVSAAPLPAGSVLLGAGVLRRDAGHAVVRLGSDLRRVFLALRRGLWLRLCALRVPAQSVRALGSGGSG